MSVGAEADKACIRGPRTVGKEARRTTPSCRLGGYGRGPGLNTLSISDGAMTQGERTECRGLDGPANSETGLSGFRIAKTPIQSIPIENIFSRS